MTGAERAALALMAWCGFCWAAQGTPCGGEGQHLARYLRAYRRGLIGRDVMTTVCQSLPVVSAGQVVADVTAPQGGTAAEDQQRAAAAGGQ